MFLVSLPSRAFTPLHLFDVGKSDENSRVKNEKKKRRDSAYFLTSAHLTNYCMKWAFLSVF